MTQTQQPEALNLEEFRAKVTRAAREPLLARIAELEEQLSAIGAGGVEPLHKQAEDGWIQDGPLLYRLTDEHRPRNRDEINVTMANSSRTEEARTRRASELLHAIRAAAPKAVPASVIAGAIKRIAELEAQLFATQQAAQGMEQDAARYHWLRKSPNPACDIALAKHFGGGRGQDFGALIDTALAAKAKQGERP